MPYDPDDASNGDEGVVLDETPESDVSDGQKCASAEGRSRTGPGRRISRAAADHQGPSTLWDDDQEWILIFDRLLNSPGKRGRVSAPDSRSGRTDTQDEVDHQALGYSAVSRSTSAPPVRQPVARKSSFGATNGVSPSVVAGAIDEAMFIAAFEQVPKLQIFSSRDLEDNMLRIREVISKPSNAWDDRVEALKKLRGVLVAGGTAFDELYQHLRLMEPALQLTLQDLRSQVVREGCITVAYLAQQLAHGADHVCLSLLPYLIDLIPNSAKVMSTSGVVAVRFVIQHVPSARLIPVITTQMTAKSREIRRACAEFLEQLLTGWSPSVLERHVTAMQEALRKGVGDADSEVRGTCRRTYWGFAAHFPQQADSLLNSLDAQHQRSLASEKAKPAGGGGLAVPTAVRSHSVLGSVSRASSRTGSRENLHRTGSLSRSSGAAQAAQVRAARGETPTREPAAPRSTSAIDLQAAQRARVRAQYAAAQRMRAGAAAGASLPGSRSVSPSCRLSYATYAAPTPDGTDHSGIRSSRCGVPRSTGTSRETSPHRGKVTALHRARTPSGGSTAGSAAARILQQSQEAETALAHALASSRQRSARHLDGASDESETSSICSERSVDQRRDCLRRFHPRRAPAAGRLGGPREPHAAAKGPEDVSEIISQIASAQWAERKEGLLNLREELRSDRCLTATELRKLTDTIGRMFMDQHTKVFGVFLETLQELVLVHAADLTSWLYVLLARLLNKMGADLLGSVIQKIEQTLEIVRTSFPAEEQLHCMCRLLTDPTQTPNTRVKVATLRHLKALFETMEPASLLVDDTLPLAVTKVLSWTTDQKSVETRNGAKAVIVAMFYLNTAQFTKLQSQLAKQHQDAVADIVQAHLRRRAGVEQTHQSRVGGPLSPASPRSPLNGSGSPTSRTPARSPRPDSAEPEYGDRSVRRAAADPQSLRLDVPDLRRTERDSASQDSGLGRASAERRLTSPVSLDAPLLEETALMSGVLTELRAACAADPPAAEARTALVTVCKLAKHGSGKLWTDNFSTLLPLLLETLQTSNSSVRELALTALSDLAQRQCCTPLFLPSMELVMVRVLEAHRERAAAEREAVRAAEQCAAVLAARLPPERVVRVLVPQIEAAQFPINQAAVKAMTRLVEHHNSELVSENLPHIMPSLLKAYDNAESSVRKVAVFCIVTIHGLCGEEVLQPHLVSLSAAKLRLLNVYIKRNPATLRTAPGSPK